MTPVVVALDASAGARAAAGDAVLDAALATVAARHPALRVERDLVAGTPVRALLHRARDARLIVVGHRGHDEGSGALR